MLRNAFDLSDFLCKSLLKPSAWRRSWQRRHKEYVEIWRQAWDTSKASWRHCKDKEGQMRTNLGPPRTSRGQAEDRKRIYERPHRQKVQIYWCFEGNPSLLRFQLFAVFGLRQIVFAAILSLFKSTKPCLWSLRLIFHVFHEKPQQLCSEVFEAKGCDVSVENTMNFSSKNDTAWSL